MDSILFSELDSEVNKSLLFLDELLVLDPIVSRVNLANKVEPLLLLCPSDGIGFLFTVKKGHHCRVILLL